jgi:hypothetical protein
MELTNKPMQADGAGTTPRHIDENGELASRRGPDQAGESGGGPYSNQQGGKRDRGKIGSFFGHGGQSEQAYHGTGQLGDDEMGAQPNAGSKER